MQDFASEYRGVHRVRWLGLRDVPVLPLERIYKSKSVVRRPKDLVHMQVLNQLMANNQAVAAKKPKQSKPRRNARP